MPRAKLDKDTQAVLDRGQKIHDFVKSEAWEIIKKMAIEKIRRNNSLWEFSFKRGENAESLVRNMQAKSAASHLMLEWISEIEGAASQFKVNEELMLREEYDSILIQLPQRSDEEYLQTNGQ